MRTFQQNRCAGPPPADRLARTLTLVGELLGASECFYARGRFHFPLGAGRSIAVSRYSARRFRIDACDQSQVRATLWSLDGADEHLAGVVLQFASAADDPVMGELR